jgi:hypothetical protein
VSGPKRTVRARPRKEPITPEMVELFLRGRALQAEGGSDLFFSHISSCGNKTRRAAV